MNSFAAPVELSGPINQMKSGAVWLDRDGRVNYANQAFLRFLRRSETDVVGKPAIDLIDPIDQADYLARFSRRPSGDHEPYPIRLRCGDGVTRASVAIPSPLFDEHGDFDGSFAIVDDDPASISALQELAVAKLIVRNSRAIVYRARLVDSFDVDFVSSNVSAYGYSAQDFASGRIKWMDIVHPDDLVRVKSELFSRYQKGETMFTLPKYRLRTAAGEYRWVDVQVTIRNVEGDVPVLEGVIIDVNDRKQIDDERQQALVQTVHALAKTIEMRDPYTSGHQRRVANLSAAIGVRLGFVADRNQGLYLGALIHDVGKIGVPAELLTKPGRLNGAEMAVVRSHVSTGIEIFREIHLPWPIADIIGQHHERLDGSGYPNALEGMNIVLEARIVAAADVLEAMSSHRPYRPALGFEQAIGELKSLSGRQFDASVVDACIQLAQQTNFDAGAFWQSLEIGATQEGALLQGVMFASNDGRD
ncbi:MAG: HD domain-containing phosphohydrolase [Alphaproteobacteria bacterium]